MRICVNCGAQFDDSELFCPKCGQEVQLVPIFETIESRMAESQRRQEEEEKKRAEEREYLLSLEKKRNARRRKIILIFVFVGIGVVAVIGGLIAVAQNRVANSYDYQLQQAQIAYEDGNLESAMEYAKRAIALSNSNRDAKFLTAQVNYANRNYDDAADTLEKLLDKYPEDRESYDLLFLVYEEMDAPEKIHARLKKCPLEDVLAKYADYIPEAPVPDVEGGSYDALQTVTLTAASGADIYYTTDGTTPTAKSSVYSEPIRLAEGRTTIRAFTKSHTGISSPEMNETYDIRLEVPPTPVISPSSGTYRKLLTTEANVDVKKLGRNISLSTPKITVEVPEGYTCYYSFDIKPDKSSTIYREPVDMRVGEHVFYAVLISTQGKMGRIASVTYVYSVVTPTPTPTPKVEQYYFPTPEVTEEPEPTEEPSADSSSDSSADPNADPSADPNAGSEPQTDPSAAPPADPGEGQNVAPADPAADPNMQEDGQTEMPVQ